MPSVNEILADAIRSHTLDVMRVERGLARRTRAELQNLYRLIQHHLDEANLTGTAPRRIARLQSLLGVVHDTIERHYRQIAETQTKELTSLAEIEHRFNLGLLRDQLPVEMNVIGLTPEQLQHVAADTAIRGAKSAEWWARQPPRTTRRFLAAVRQGILLGETNDQIRRRLQSDVFNLNNREATALVRTSVQAVANRAKEETMRANHEMIRAVQWVSTFDSRTTPQCMARGGHLYDPITYDPLDGGPPWEEGPGSIHFQCVHPDTLVDPIGGIRAVSRRPYDGDLIVIRTAAHRELSCTPNHPILTQAGWKAAKAINLSDKVICYFGRERMPIGADDKHQNVKSTIHDIAEAAFRSRQMFTKEVPLTAPDFHGDASDGEVAIIGTDRRLLPVSNPPLIEKASQCFLIWRSRLAGFLSAFCAGDQRLFAPLGPPHGIMGGGRPSLDFFGAAVVHPGLLLFGTVPNLNAVLSQDSFNWTKRHAEIASDPLKSSTVGIHGDDGFFDIFAKLKALPRPRDDGRLSVGPDFNAVPSQDLLYGTFKDAEFIRNPTPSPAPDCVSSEILLDDVVFFGRRKYSGHVYNLETESGTYCSADIVSHNCRSTSIPITKAAEEFGLQLPRSTRASLDGQVPADLSFDDWLRGKGEAFQNQALGPERAKLFRNNGLSTSQLVDATTGRVLSVAELAAIVGA